jgi:hypothetical protein
MWSRSLLSRGAHPTPRRGHDAGHAVSVKLREIADRRSPSTSSSQNRDVRCSCARRSRSRDLWATAQPFPRVRARRASLLLTQSSHDRDPCPQTSPLLARSLRSVFAARLKPVTPGWRHVCHHRSADRDSTPRYGQSIRTIRTTSTRRRSMLVNGDVAPHPAPHLPHLLLFCRRPLEALQS